MDIIIGAGVTGLSYAMYTPKETLILEKEDTYGGYCRTIKQGGFVWDYSGHFFHFRNSDIKDKVLSGIDADDLLEVEKITRIKYKDLYVDFPFQKNIHQLPKEEFIECLYDLYFADNKTDSISFKSMVVSKLGKGISEKFLIPYNEKLYACDLDALDSDAMGRFFPAANLTDIIKNFKDSDNTSYNDSFIYPKGGAIQYIDSIYQQIKSPNVKYSSSIKSIDLKNHIVHTEISSYKYDRLISTIPFTDLLNLCNVDYDNSVFSANKVLVFNLGFDKKGHDTKTCWVYFPEKKYLFYRVGYYDNIMRTDRMSLYVEVGYPSDFDIVEREELLLERVIADLKEAEIIHDEEMIEYKSVVMNPAYVHISQKAMDELKRQKEMLAKHDVYSIGRYGSWTYCSIEDNIMEARELAKKLK